MGAGQYYALCPQLTPGGNCFRNDTSSWQSVISHEVLESIADPSPNSGWYDNTAKQEGGDTCNFNFQNLPFGAVQAFQDNRQQACSLWISRILLAPGATVTALTPRDGHIDLFATGPDGTVWSAWWEAQPGWQNWFAIAPAVKMQPGATVTALTPRDGHIDLFATGSDGTVWSTWWEAQPGWQNWFPIAPGTKMQPGATVTALTPRAGHIDLFATGGDGTVWSTWWEAGPGWQNWFSIAALKVQPGPQ